MKICIIGLGSIGKKHLNNIVTVLNNRNITFMIDAYRSSRTLLNRETLQYINMQYYSLKELPDDYDVVFITNPTVFHYDTMKAMVDKTKHMFIEKPVFHKKSCRLEKVNLKEDGIYYVACPLRHKAIFQTVKEKLQSGEKVICARAISTSYLPNWRKNVDYKTTYSAYKELGGGVSLDLIHEWDYIIDLFGEPESLYHREGHYSGLEIKSEDLSVYIADYGDKLIEVHIDYLGHKEERKLELFFDSLKIEIDLLHNVWEEYRENRMVVQKRYPTEDMYINEMEYFFDCIQGKNCNINTVQKASKVMELVL